MKSKFKVGDKVRILDGSKIRSYTGGWWMPEDAGKTGTIARIANYSNPERVGYYLKELDYCYDERGLELVREDWQVLIVPDGDKTIGKLFEDGKLTTTVETKKHPRDEYSIKEAIKSITARLVEEREKAESKFRVGDIVEIVECDNSNIPVGVRGEVVFVNSNGIDIGVDFKMQYDPWTHNLWGNIKTTTGRWYDADKLKLVHRP